MRLEIKVIEEKIEHLEVGDRVTLIPMFQFDEFMGFSGIIIGFEEGHQNAIVKSDEGKFHIIPQNSLKFQGTMTSKTLTDSTSSFPKEATFTLT